MLLAVFVATILMSALNPLVTKVEKKGIPRYVAIFLVFVLILLILMGTVAAVVPPLIEQTSSLINKIPATVDRLGIYSINQQVISDQFGSIPSNIARFIIGIFSNVISLLTLFVVTFYLLAERENLHRYLVVFFGDHKKEERAEKLINQIEHQIGGWVRGQVALMVIIGLFSYIGLRILGVNFALPLSLLAGFLELIPNIGPMIALIPAVLIASSTSTVTALATAALYFLIQQFENNIIVPKIMQKAVGVKPLTTIISLMVGIKLAGVLGAILAIPTYIVVKILFVEFFGSRKLSEA